MNCKSLRKLSSQYVDVTLSARLTWEVDRHLAECHDCTALISELRKTVIVLSAAPRFAASDDFTTKLQDRLRAIEPAPVRFSILSGLTALFRPRWVPAWGAALVVCAVAVPLLLQGAPIGDIAGDLVSEEVSMTQTARTHNIALAATDPLGDLAAAGLAANSHQDVASADMR